MAHWRNMGNVCTITIFNPDYASRKFAEDARQKGHARCARYFKFPIARQLGEIASPLRLRMPEIYHPIKPYFQVKGLIL